MPESEVERNIKDLFKREIKVIRVRSYRAMKMEYEQASFYDMWFERLEFIFLCLFFVGLGFGLYNQSAVGGTILASPGLIVTLFDAVNKLYCSHKSQDFVPFMRVRAVTHNNAAANWQWLQLTAESRLIMLNNPDTQLETVEKWYAELCDKRKEICANVIVRQDVYEKFNKKENFNNSNLKYKEINTHLTEMLPSLEIEA